MHDFDVGAVSLSSPPASAVIQSYRPAVLVRNNGVHDALASGSLRIYSPAGLLIYTTAIYSAVIAPGETKPAQADTYWTPPALGRYMAIAYVSCINDQYEPNNNLAPVHFDVIPGEPPPPTTVPLHAAQHEEGGQDELSIDGLHGRATDAQTPLAHKTSHQVAGSDALDVTGLTGILATGQPIADHHETHENHGDDELNVDDLSGVLANLQKPKVHANEAHDPNYATDADFDAHKTATTAHENRRDVAGGFCGLDSAAEVPSGRLAPVPTVPGNHFLKVGKTWEEAQVLSEKGAANGYAELDDAGIVPVDQIGLLATEPTTPEEDVLHADRCFYPPLAAAPLGHKTSHETGGTDELSIEGLHGQVGDPQVYVPVAHAASHEVNGPDEMNVGGLAGTLLEPQTPELHAGTHAYNGDDKISIAGLEGIPASVGQAEGIAPLDEDGLVPLDHLPPFVQGAHKTTHENGGTDEISVSGLSGVLADPQTAAAHKATHQTNGADEISVNGLHGILADTQPPASHGNTLHSTSATEPSRLTVLDIGTAGTSDSVARADHYHTGPGAVKTQGGVSFELWNTPRPMVAIEIGNGLYDRRGLTLETMWRGTCIGYIVGQAAPRNLEMRARLTTAGITTDLALATVALAPALGHIWYFQFDCTIRGHSAGLVGIGRLTASLEDGTLPIWAQGGTFFNPVPFIINNPAELDIAAKMSPIGGEDAGVMVSGFELLYTPTPAPTTLGGTPAEVPALGD